MARMNNRFQPGVGQVLAERLQVDRKCWTDGRRALAILPVLPRLLFFYLAVTATGTAFACYVW